MLRYKFLNKNLKSTHGNLKWKIGEWKTAEGELSLCQNGFHCSKKIYQAFSYVPNEVLAKVEVRGKHIDEKDKEVWEEMRIVKAWQWKKKDSVELAIYAAELVLDIYEKKYPEDKRPRQAIEAAKNWLKHPTAHAAHAAHSAADAADAAAHAAARAAAYAADAAAYALIKKISDWIDKRLSTLKEINA